MIKMEPRAEVCIFLLLNPFPDSARVGPGVKRRHTYLRPLWAVAKRPSPLATQNQKQTNKKFQTKKKAQTQNRSDRPGGRAPMGITIELEFLFQPRVLS